MQYEVIEMDSRPEREREAFSYWCGEGDGNMAKVARDLDIPLRTLHSWKDRYGWKAERQEANDELAILAFDLGKIGFTRVLGSAVRRLEAMLADDSASQHDQRENIRLLLGATLLHNPPVPETFVDARQVHFPPGSAGNGPPLPPGIPNGTAGVSTSKILEGNIASVTEGSKRGKRRTF